MTKPLTSRVRSEKGFADVYRLEAQEPGGVAAEDLVPVRFRQPGNTGHRAHGIGVRHIEGVVRPHHDVVGAEAIDQIG
jgi:hypothetical protein